MEDLQIELLRQSTFSTSGHVKGKAEKTTRKESAPSEGGIYSLQGFSYREVKGDSSGKRKGEGKGQSARSSQVKRGHLLQVGYRERRGEDARGGCWRDGLNSGGPTSILLYERIFYVPRKAVEKSGGGTEKPSNALRPAKKRSEGKGSPYGESSKASLDSERKKGAGCKRGRGEGKKAHAKEDEKSSSSLN